MRQRTLEKAISFSGIGTHSGHICDILLRPAPENNGIVFHRKDINEFIDANYKLVSESMMCTKLTNAADASIMTIEHLCAAFYGLGISNAVVECQSQEIPILDGSSLIFVESIKEQGIKIQNRNQKRLKILKHISVEIHKSRASISPEDSFSINLIADYAHKGLETSHYSFDFAKGDFTKEIAPARTFGFIEDLEFLKNNNLSLGVSLDNVVAFNELGVPINVGGLRFCDEVMRHKALDVIGDFSLSTYEIVGRFDGFCTGHHLNNLLLREIFSDKDNFEIIE